MDNGESDEPVRVDRFNAEMRTMERAVQYVHLHTMVCTCSRTGKEMEAAAIWQVGNRGGGSVSRDTPYGNCNTM